MAPTFQKAPHASAKKGKCVLPVPKGMGAQAKAILQSRQTGGSRADLCRPSKPHSFIVPPGLRAVELVGGVGLEKDILYLAFGMTNE